MKMVEVKTADLIGPALDWIVCVLQNGTGYLQDVCGAKLGDCILVAVKSGKASPSTNWAQGGPLIDKFSVGFAIFNGMWLATAKETNESTGFGVYGKNHLIAACRAIVASEFGDTVMVPAELINGDER